MSKKLVVLWVLAVTVMVGLFFYIGLGPKAVRKINPSYFKDLSEFGEQSFLRLRQNILPSRGVIIINKGDPVFGVQFVSGFTGKWSKEPVGSFELKRIGESEGWGGLEEVSLADLKSKVMMKKPGERFLFLAAKQSDSRELSEVAQKVGLNIIEFRELSRELEEVDMESCSQSNPLRECLVLKNNRALIKRALKKKFPEDVFWGRVDQYGHNRYIVIYSSI
jgi:hypothetical protein